MELALFLIKNLTFNEYDSTLNNKYNYNSWSPVSWFPAYSEPKQIPHSQYRHSAREYTDHQLKKEGNAYGY